VPLLIHGATYDHSYWDFGTIDGIDYSYAREVAAAGFPTFALDEIGAGASSHAPSSAITIQIAAYVAHQVIQGLLDGSIGPTRFGKVMEVGHSFGSMTTIEEAATYRDVAGAVITGNTHMNPAFSSIVQADQYPAIEDPTFAARGLDDGYLTTKPGTRGRLFYNEADADPNVIAADEARKDVFSATEFATGIVTKTTSLSRQIAVPVLVIDGTNDVLDCGVEATGGYYSCSSGEVIAQEEAPYYAAAAQLRACAIPTAGHDLSLSRNQRLQVADAVLWSFEYVGHRPVGALPSRALPADCSEAAVTES
jgi:pimeloyl-ACP methyl ester carboxylesterase